MFDEKRAHKEHIKTHGINYNKCPRCPGVEFKSWPEHQEHQHKTHDGVFFYRCKDCPEVFENKTLRSQHRREKHQKGKLVQCNDCGILVCDMSSHKLRKHQTKREHKCDICKKLFPTKSILDEHRKKHASICCEQCGKSIPASKDKQRLHNLMHHTPEHEKPFVCSLCVPVKGFAIEITYEDHMNIHKGIKPHVCNLCPNVGYASRANLNAHERATHQGKKRKPKL